MKGKVRSVYSSTYSATLFDIMKTYSSIIMTRQFQRMNIPKLPVFTTEDGIKTIRSYLNTLKDWKILDELIPKNYIQSKKLKKTGKAGIFSASLELTKEGNLKMKQDKLFDKLFVRKNI